MQRCAFKILAALMLTSLAVALAAAPPNLSGAWKANLAKSYFGQMPAPTSMATKIDHKEPSLKISTTFVGDQGEMTFERNLQTDGSETTNQFGPFTMKSKAKWEGSVLVVDSKGSTDNGDVAVKEKWTLSEDGKTLTVVSDWSTPQGEMTHKVIYEKQ
jgi:hypothetical protein